MNYGGPAFRFLAHPLPSLFSRQYAIMASHRKTEKERQLSGERGGERGGPVAESHDRNGKNGPL
jgi:hypothetical protein